MARIFGLRTGLWLGGLGLLLIVPPLAILDTALAALVLAGGAALLGGISAYRLHRRNAALTASHDKLSAEIDLLSRQVLKLEALAAAALQAEARRQDATPDAEVVASEIAEVTREIGLLSGIVHELANVVAAQEGDIEVLRVETAELARNRMPQIPPVMAPPPRADAPQAVGPARPEPAPFRPALVRSDPASASAPPSDRDLVEAFDGEGLELWLQPIVTLPQRKVVSYEALARVRVGSEIFAPDAFLPAFERHGRTTALDRRMLAKVATVARHLLGRGSNAVVGYSLSPHSLYEPGFLRSLGDLVSGESELANRITVALAQASWRGLDAEQKAVLGTLRGRIGLMLDRPVDLRFETSLLAEHGVGQVKASAELLLRTPLQAVSDIALEDLVTSLARAGIRLVAGDVAQEADVPDLIDLDVPMAQGAVFAAPRPVRTDVVAARPEQPVEPAPSEPPDQDPPPQRRSFRDFLRRAV